MMWGWGTGSWLGGLWMVLFWVGVVLLIVWAVRFVPSGGQSQRGSSALEILEESGLAPALESELAASL